MNDLGGVWRTVGGRRIFIKDGEDLQTAMKKSGKFEKNEYKEKAKQRWEELTKDNPDYDKEQDRIEKKEDIFEDEGRGFYNDTTQEELNSMPVALKIFGQYSKTCYIYKNRSALMKDVQKAYGGFNQITDYGKSHYSISSKSGIGEYYLIRDRHSKGGWKWQDCNGENVPSDKTGFSNEYKSFRS